MNSTFNREYDSAFVDNFMNHKSHDAFIECFYSDAQKGNVFLAFRPKKKVSVYFEGRKLCEIKCSNSYEPLIDSKYLPVLKSDATIGGQVTEKQWKELTGVSKYTWGDLYPEIIDNLKKSSDPEAIQTSGLYKFSPLACKESEIILLDIEAKFSYPAINRIKNDDKRIDAILYNSETKKLIFLEVKRFVDDRLQINGELQKGIIEQLSAYKDLIENEKTQIIQEYNKVLEAYSKISGIQLNNIDENSDILLGLLITDYTNKDKITVKKLAKQIFEEVKVPVLSKGKAKKVPHNTLVNKWYPSMIKQKNDK